MTRWAPFLWLTAIVLVSLLALARLSSGVVRDGDEPRVPDRPAPDHLGEPRPSEPAANPSEQATSPSGRGHGDVWTPSPPGPAERGGDGTASAPVTNGQGGAVADGVPTAPGGRPPTDARPSTPAGSGRVELSWGMLLANVAVTQGVVGLVLGVGIVWFDVPLSALGVSAEPWVGGLPALGLGVALGLVLWVGNEAAAGLADAVGAGYDEAVRGMLTPDSARGWAVLLGFVLPTVAVVEELLFRAALIGAPAAATPAPPWLLAIGSSIAFALGHGAQGRVGIAVTGALGLVLAAGYVLTGSLLVVIVAHYVVNATEFVVHEGLGFDRPW